MGVGTFLKTALWLHIFVPQMSKQIPSAEKQTNYLESKQKDKQQLHIDSWLTPSAPCFSSTPKSCSCSWDVSMKPNNHLKQSCDGWSKKKRKIKECQTDIKKGTTNVIDKPKSREPAVRPDYQSFQTSFRRAVSKLPKIARLQVPCLLP